MTGLERVEQVGGRARTSVRLQPSVPFPVLPGDPTLNKAINHDTHPHTPNRPDCRVIGFCVGRKH
jgi:hypothetical protein